MENILPIIAEEIFPQYYIDYSMSVITDRALPDVRDGLKPVHRRILHAMNGLGLVPEKGYKKCARIVGEVLGKYHPHGDTSVYDALVRLAQSWSLRYPLVDGHGNFGNEDGDSPAAMRYTEAKMNKFTLEMLRDINKNTVDFMPNFDGEEQEPVVLPSRFPNLLVNGVSGIAVGFASNMPTHNLCDSIDTLIYLIDNPDCKIDDLVKILKAPDFPTGGTIINPNDMLSIYSNGIGKIKIRGKYKIENNQIIFYEIPYQVNKIKLTESILDLANGYYKKKDGKKDEFIQPVIPQITELEDESNHLHGIRIIITVDKEENINYVLKMLFEKTKLQDNFDYRANVVKGNKLIEKIDLKRLCSEYVEFQKEVLTRRSKFQLDKAVKRLNILYGYIIATNNIDDVVEIIKTSSSKQEAGQRLSNKYSLNDSQIEAILNMRLSSLIKLEIDKINLEKDKLEKLKQELEEILSSEIKLLELLKKELIEIKEKYSDERKTDILYEDTLKDVDISNNLAEDYNCRVLLTQSLIKKHLRQSESHKIKSDETILCDIPCNNKDNLYLFTDKGNRYLIKCNNLQTFKPSVYGQSINSVINISKDEKPLYITPIYDKGYMIFLYSDGYMAKINAQVYTSNTKCMKAFNTEKEIVAIKYIEDDVDVMMVTSKGKGLIVNTETLESKNSKTSKGNKFISLDDNILVYTNIGIQQNDVIIIEDKEFDMSNIAKTGNKEEARTWYDYIKGNRGNKGNIILK